MLGKVDRNLNPAHFFLEMNFRRACQYLFASSRDDRLKTIPLAFGLCAQRLYIRNKLFGGGRDGIMAQEKTGK